MLVLRKNHFRIVPIGSLLPVSFPIEIRNVGSAKYNIRLLTKIKTQNMFIVLRNKTRLLHQNSKCLT